MFKETLKSKIEVSYLGGRQKFREVAMQAIGNLRMCTGCLMMMASVAFSGHIIMMVLAGAESAVVRIQTSSDICVGRVTSEVFLICNEHCEVISAGLLSYRVETNDSGFAKDWKGVVILQN